MLISHGNLHVRSLVGTLLLLAPLALAGVSGLATAQSLPSASLGVTDPTAPLALTPAERTAIRDAVRSLQLPGRSPLDQARSCFDWVCRHVILREVPGQMLQPPLFAQSCSSRWDTWRRGCAPATGRCRKKLIGW